jgi:hypothetical protein
MFRGNISPPSLWSNTSSQASNLHEAHSKQSLQETSMKLTCCLIPSCCFLAWLTLWPWRWRQYVRKKSLQETNMKLTCYLIPSCCFLAWLTLWPWRWRQYVPPKHKLTFIELHGNTSQMTTFFLLCFSPTDLVHVDFDIIVHGAQKWNFDLGQTYLILTLTCVNVTVSH